MLSATCGGHIAGANGTLLSPNYPQSYENNTDCEWFIEGPTGHYLQLSFTDLRLDPSLTQENCSASDFVEIRDFNATGEATRAVFVPCHVHNPHAYYFKPEPNSPSSDPTLNESNPSQSTVLVFTN